MMSVKDSDCFQECTGMVCDSNISVSASKQLLEMDLLCVT